MHRNLIGASSALAILALLAGAPATGIAHENNNLCNVILDGDGEPVLENDSDNIGHSNSEVCGDGDSAGAVENTAEPTETAAVVEAPAPKVAPAVVYFDTNEDSLDAASRAEVEAYVVALMATSPKSLDVVGFTDTSGSADLNARLSAARADNVSKALIEAGVPPGMIEVGASGEDGLAIDTPDGTREANNRRVTVTPTY